MLTAVTVCFIGLKKSSTTEKIPVDVFHYYKLGSEFSYREIVREVAYTEKELRVTRKMKQRIIYMAPHGVGSKIFSELTGGWLEIYICPEIRTCCLSGYWFFE
jgi:hypothetical protein